MGHRSGIGTMSGETAPVLNPLRRAGSITAPRLNGRKPGASTRMTPGVLSERPFGAGIDRSRSLVHWPAWRPSSAEVAHNLRWAPSSVRHLGAGLGTAGPELRRPGSHGTPARQGGLGDAPESPEIGPLARDSPWAHATFLRRVRLRPGPTDPPRDRGRDLPRGRVGVAADSIETRARPGGFVR